MSMHSATAVGQQMAGVGFYPSQEKNVEENVTSTATQYVCNNLKYMSKILQSLFHEVFQSQSTL